MLSTNKSSFVASAISRLARCVCPPLRGVRAICLRTGVLRRRVRLQEAISVGMNSATTFDDNIISSYRTHPFAILRGGDVKSLIGELLGRVCGISKGKGGSMHVFTEAFQGGHGIVGAQVPLGAGLAFAQKYLGKKTATFAMYGDGASNQGQVFESYNMVRSSAVFLFARLRLLISRSG